MTEGKQTPILDALETLNAAGGMCGFRAGEMAILSDELFDRMVVELSYRGEIARTRAMLGPGGVQFLAIDMPHVRVYRPVSHEEFERVISAGES
jgi:hypothetical protein